MQRFGIFAPGEYYHVFGRGNYKQKIFLNNADYYRFLFSILYFQGKLTFPKMSRLVPKFVQSPTLDSVSVGEIIESRKVELVNFCLMPNHYHMTVKEIKEGGVSQYMQRVLTSYTKYHNTKYEKQGHLFQGPFKAVNISDNDQLLYLSAYVHNNPSDLKKWHGKERLYMWSSYKDYVRENRWGQLLVPDIVLGQFDEGNEYKSFVEESTAKKNIFKPDIKLD